MNRSEELETLLNNLKHNKTVHETSLKQITTDDDETTFVLSRLAMDMEICVSSMMEQPEFESEEEMANTIYTDLEVISKRYNICNIAQFTNAVFFMAMMRRGNIPRERVHEIYNETVTHYDNDHGVVSFDKILSPELVLDLLKPDNENTPPS